MVSISQHVVYLPPDVRHSLFMRLQSSAKRNILCSSTRRLPRKYSSAPSYFNKHRVYLSFSRETCPARYGVCKPVACGVWPGGGAFPDLPQAYSKPLTCQWPSLSFGLTTGPCQWMDATAPRPPMGLSGPIYRTRMHCVTRAHKGQ